MSIHKEMSAGDVMAIEHLIDRYSVAEVLYAVAYICGAKAEHLATNWQDAHSAKSWMNSCVAIDALAARHALPAEIIS